MFNTRVHVFTTVHHAYSRILLVAVCMFIARRVHRKHAHHTAKQACKAQGRGGSLEASGRADSGQQYV